jgi:ABC-type antimicrobial peptide transport system permease subunit
MGLVGIGFLVGAGLAAAAAQVLSGVLYVTPFDLPSFGVTLLILGCTAALANLIPARRASRVDPARSLRAE